MFKVCSQLYLLAQSFMDELKNVDWGDEDQSAQPGYVNESNYNDFLADDLDEIDTDTPELQPEVKPDTYKPEQPTQPPPRPTETTPTTQPQQPEEIEYDSPKQLIVDGIKNYELISFDYTTRFGNYGGYRTVEPHYTFIAKDTGNEILVSFDKNYNDIRAFIVGNIHPYGVRYKGLTFQPRNEVMVGV